mmetsp:Transcript_25375/g.56404  ORF Transcript_25375/g.56404 Transcript_25375/m.56404 type:complete len:89 (-) Transcript_25375:379-645(-)
MKATRGSTSRGGAGAATASTSTIVPHGHGLPLPLQPNHPLQHHIGAAGNDGPTAFLPAGKRRDSAYTNEPMSFSWSTGGASEKAPLLL